MFKPSELPLQVFKIVDLGVKNHCTKVSLKRVKEIEGKILTCEKSEPVRNVFILFTEVSIANRPFEHILWPEVFNFR